MVEPDQPIFFDSDVEAYQSLLAGMQFFSWPELVSFTRVMGSSMGRIAEAATSLFASDVARPMVEAGASESEVEERGVQAAALAEGLTGLLAALFRMHLGQSSERSRIARGHGAVGGVL
ncbi:hypothetical protein V6O07_15785, partial [Arthrospira platensis SPKY2]